MKITEREYNMLKSLGIDRLYEFYWRTMHRSINCPMESPHYEFYYDLERKINTAINLMLMRSDYD